MTCPVVIEVVTPGPPGAPGDAIQMTGPAVLGRATGTGAAGELPIGSGLAITNGALVATAQETPGTDLSYNASTRLLSSSTGQDVTLPLAGTDAGLLAGVGFTGPAGWTASGSVSGGSITLSLGLPAGFGLISTADQSKLTGIAAGATANATDAQLRDRSTHTGTQSAGTITGLATVATSGAYADLSGRPALGTAAATDASAYATAAQGAKADSAVQPAALSIYVQTGDARLTDAREWSAETISQAEAEAGTATTRRAFTAQRVFQAIAAWWAASSAKTKLDGIATGATANSSDATLLARANHTGTQTASTISDFAATAAAAAPVQSVAGKTGSVTLSTGDISGLGTFATANAATPPAIGGTTPAAGAFTTLGLPAQGSAPGTPATGFTLFANSSNAFGWRGANGFLRVFDGTANTADRTYTLPNASGTVALTSDIPATPGVVSTSTAGLAPATSYAAITYAAEIELDLAALDGQVRTISLTGNLSLTSINRAAGRSVTLRLICDGTQRTLTFPAGWVFVGTKPANIAASKTAVLSVTWFGTATTDAVAAYAVQS